MTSSSQSKHPQRRWRFIFILAGIAVLAWASLAGYRVLKSEYRHWKSERALGQARAFIAAKDFAKARLALEVAYRSGANGEAYAVLADLLESANSARAVDARRAAVRATPGSLAAELGLAATAIHFGDNQTALEALSACSAADKAKPEYLRVAAVLALSLNRPGLADYLLAQLEKATPGDSGVRLLRAAALLRHPLPAKSAEGRAELIELMKDPGQRLPALRLAVDDAISRHDDRALKTLGLQLASSPDASFADLLTAANCRLRSDPDHRLDAALAERIDRQARQNQVSADLYVEWLIVQNRTPEASIWLDGLSPPLADSPAMHFFRSRIDVARSDWKSLRSELAAGAWGPLSPAALEFAYSSRLLLQHGQPEVARQTWNAALGEAQNSSAALHGLLRLAEVWRWSDARRDSLFALARAFPRETENFTPLIQVLHGRNESIAMRDAFALWRQAAPDIAVVRYNWALLSLLINPGALPTDATRAMQELQSQDSSNAYYATGCALALWEMGRVKEACALIDKLSDADKKFPARAPYLAVIYAADHRVAEARAALGRAPAPPHLLPEEAALLAQASALCGG